MAAGAGEEELDDGLDVLNRALHAFRLVTADPYLHPVGRRQAIVARVGFGAGEQVADGLWTDARELTAPERPAAARRACSRPRPAWQPCSAPASGRWPARSWPCARAWTSITAAPREAALQLLVALDAALAELAADPHAGALAERLDELRGQREAVAGAAQAALRARSARPSRGRGASRWGAIEAALRARARVARAP